MRIGDREFQTSGRTYVMGILNVTPDSFSDGGKYTTTEQALAHALKMAEDGADIIDIGGESTRPGYAGVETEEEIRRIVPVIARVKQETGLPISVDTCHAETAKAALAAGADLVNDIRGLRTDPDMAGVIAASGAACCLMHSRFEADYTDFLTDFYADLSQTLQIARDAGIADERIILDPGVGFGKTVEQNLILTRKVDELRAYFGYPVLLGTSRKSMIGKTLDLPVNEREEGTLATTVMAVERGCMFVRVHNVKANVRAVRMTEAILAAGREN